MYKRHASNWRIGFVSRFLAGLIALPLCAGTASAEPNSDVASARVLASASGYYFDSNGERVAFDPLYEGWFDASRAPVYPLRALLENVALLGIEVGVYWYDADSSVVDWQYPDLGSKITSREAFRFDDNLTATNYLFHPFAGTTHYVVTRSNGFGVLGGLLVAAGSSAIYELVLEWKELVSMNDLLVTPVGGSAMGEFFFQLGNYLNSEVPPERSHAGLGEALHLGVKSTIGLPRELHNVIDRPNPAPRAANDNLGLSSAYWHRFRVLLAQEMVADGGGVQERLLGADIGFELAAMPGFMRIGQFERAFAHGNFTSFVGRLVFAGESHDAELNFDSHLFGYYLQSFAATSSGKRGYANEVALGTGLQYLAQAWPGQADEYGVVHMLSPVERVWLALGPAELHVSTRLSLDFASIDSLSYDRLPDSRDRSGEKSSLLRHGYLHSWGFSGGALAELSVGGLQLGAQADFARYESLDGAERFQEKVSQDTHGSESLLRTKVYLRVEPERSPLSGKLELSRDARYSALGSLYTERAHVRFLTALGVRF